MKLRWSLTVVQSGNTCLQKQRPGRHETPQNSAPEGQPSSDGEWIGPENRVRAGRLPPQSRFRKASLSDRAKKKWGLRLRQERPARGVWSGANHHTLQEKSEAPPCRSVVRASRCCPAAEERLQLPCRFCGGSHFSAVLVAKAGKNKRHSTAAELGLRGAGQWPRLVQGGRFCAACRILQRPTRSWHAPGMAGSTHRLQEAEGSANA